MNPCIRILFGPDEYLTFLTLEGEISQIIRIPRDRKIGTVVKFSELPYPVKQEIEDNLDPHFL